MSKWMAEWVNGSTEEQLDGYQASEIVGYRSTALTRNHEMAVTFAEP
jgi:hypothetical protein